MSDAKVVASFKIACMHSSENTCAGLAFPAALTLEKAVKEQMSMNNLKHVR